MNVQTTTLGLLCFLFTTCFIANVDAQAEQTTFIAETQEDTYPEGTYQIVLSDERIIEPSLSNYELEQISVLRHATLIVYYQVNAYVKIRILPVSTIEAEGFVAPPKYVYED